eukprot:3746938-Prymnesium_polylepis.1
MRSPSAREIEPALRPDCTTKRLPHCGSAVISTTRVSGASSTSGARAARPQPPHQGLPAVTARRRSQRPLGGADPLARAVGRTVLKRVRTEGVRMRRVVDERGRGAFQGSWLQPFGADDEYIVNVVPIGDAGFGRRVELYPHLRDLVVRPTEWRRLPRPICQTSATGTGTVGNRGRGLTSRSELGSGSGWSKRRLAESGILEKIALRSQRRLVVHRHPIDPLATSCADLYAHDRAHAARLSNLDGEGVDGRRNAHLNVLGVTLVRIDGSVSPVVELVLGAKGE